MQLVRQLLLARLETLGRLAPGRARMPPAGASCPRRRPSGGRAGSWPRRATLRPPAEPAAPARPCRSRCSRGRGCPTLPIVQCSRGRTSAPRPTAAAAARSRPSLAMSWQYVPAPARHLAALARESARRCGCWCRAGRSAERQRSSPARISASGPRHHRVADPDADRRQDVALLAVGVVEQRDARRAVRVVLDRSPPSPGCRPCPAGNR